MAKLSERLAFFQSLGGQALVDDILASGRAFEAAERRFDSPSSKTTVEWRTPGQVVSYEQIESGLLLRCEQGWCRILWLAPNCAHIRWSQSADGFPPQPSFAVEKRDWPLVELELEESGDWLLLRSMTHRYRIYRPALRLSVETLEGETLCSDSLGMQIGSNAAVRLSMRMTADEACYGLGERSRGP